jgi:hypothetical protein
MSQLELILEFNKNKNIIMTNHHSKNKETYLEQKNRGTGAGGKNTNKNGLSFERKTDLRNSEYYTITKRNKNREELILSLDDFEVNFIRLKGTGFIKEFNLKQEDLAHGCKRPDEVYYNECSKTIFIIEKKNQNCGGSVCEKIQTGQFKKDFFQTILEGYNVHYIYCLSDWFKDNCIPELRYLEKHNIPVFWGDDDNYTWDIINYILEHY